MIKPDVWENCYVEMWKGFIVDEAFCHPAKFSHALIGKIFDHALKNGWVKRGDYCLDPFAGVALEALHSLVNGLNWIGIELEPKFVALGQQNIDLWTHKFRDWPHLGTARIIQGDSREIKFHIAKFLGEPGLIVSSPPYQESDNVEGKFTPNANSRGYKYEYSEKAKYRRKQDYGHTPGNLANMKEEKSPKISSEIYNEDKEEIEKVESLGHTYHCACRMVWGDGECECQKRGLIPGLISAIISSPPFSDCERGGTGIVKHSANCSCNYCRKNKGNAGNVQGGKWGTNTPGQLGSMKEGEFSAIVSSPPFEDCLHTLNHGLKDLESNPNMRGRKRWRDKRIDDYGTHENNLGNTSGDTFWEASKTILQGCYDLLKPGGHAIWVCKDYVKAGKRVPFSNRWAALCESVGFKLVCWHHASLVQHHGDQYKTNGEIEHIETRRISFFRRLAEKKGAPKIEWEDIICMEKT